MKHLKLKAEVRGYIGSKLRVHELNQSNSSVRLCRVAKKGL